MKYDIVIKFYKKELAILNRYHNHFRTAVKHDYCRNLTDKEIEEIHSIWQRVIGKPYPLCKSCGKSKLNFIKMVGKYYLTQIGEEV